MRLLVLGGTVFLGRAVAAHAVSAGHEVTCAARGESGQPPPGVRFVRVDRDQPGGLGPLADERFDAAVDVSRRPSHARRALDELAGRVGHWCYVSSASVYADTSTPGQRAATAPLLPAAPEGVDDADGQYGPCKVACEQAFGPSAFLCRAGLIVGPEDRSGRFTYWVRRLARGGEVLAPGRPEDLVQWVDVRDLAGWLVHAAEVGLSGAYDGIGAPVGRAELLAGVARGLGVEPRLTWVDQEFLSAHEVNPWAGERSLPMWLPLPEYAGFMSRDVTDSLAAGLVSRDVAATAADTETWLRVARPCTDGWPGLDADAEADLLARLSGQPA